MKAIVTGGAGFIGSHLVDRLLNDGYEVKVIDNLCTSTDRYLKAHYDNPKFKFVKLDILELEKMKAEFSGYDIVFHFAANADIRRGLLDTYRDLEQNTIATYNILEAMRVNDIKEILFASSAAVYGEPETFPTPEDIAPIQTSFYGASKLAGEGLIQAFCEGFGYRSWIFRFVSVVGERHPHGVTFDFYHKLKADSTKLEIIGDGTQRKSYMYIGDCIDGIMLAYKNGMDKVNIFNLGWEEYINVKTVADIITNELGLQDVKYEYTGGKRGWVGDSPLVHLSIEKLKSIGWNPKVSCEEGIRRTVRWLRENDEGQN
jgi:UDP-glucose 4-epimerase